MKKNRLIIILAVVLISVIMFSGITFAADEEPVRENFAVDILGGLAEFFGQFLHGAFFKNSDNNLDGLVYNQGARSSGGIILTTPGPLRTFFIQFYLVFQYMAICFFLPLGLWTGTYFRKAGEDARVKLALKEKIFRMFVTIILLYSAPTILDMMFAINNALVSVFHTVAINLFSNAADNAVQATAQSGLLMESFEAQIDSKNATAGQQIAYLITVFLNIWTLFYYYIRDITISFLFIIFPIIAILLPFNPGTVVTWFKEQGANIFTQTIHASLFTVLIAMATMLPYSFANTMFIATAFAMVIPMTGIVKRLLGVEGSIGGASTMAGIGMMYGAFRLGSVALSGLRAHGRNLVGGVADRAGIWAEEKGYKPQVGTSSTDQELSPTNTASAKALSKADLEKRKADAWRRIGKGAAGLSLGTATGITFGLGAIPFGANSALMIGAGGAALGGKIGGLAGLGAAQGLNASGYLMNLNSDRSANTELSDQENLAERQGGRIAGDFGNDPLIAKQRKAYEKERFLNTMGMPTLAKISAAGIYSPPKISKEELSKIGNLKEYKDQNRSILYSEAKSGNKIIHWMGEGDQSLTQGITRDITFNDGSLSPADDLYREYSDDAQNKAFDMTGIYEEKNPLVKQTRDRLFNGSLKSYEQSVNVLRQQTGLNNITYGSMTEPYKESTLTNIDYQDAQSAVNHVLAMKGVKNETLSPVNGLENIVELDTGVGFQYVTQGASIVFRADNDGKNAEIVAYGPGDHSLGSSSMQYGRVKFDQGNALEEQIKYSVNGMRFDKSVPPAVLNDANERFNAIAQKIPVNTDIIVTVSNQEGSQGMYRAFNAETGHTIGAQPIPREFLGKEIHGNSYHVNVDSNRNFQNYYYDRMQPQDYATQLLAEQRQLAKSEAKLEEIKAIRQTLVDVRSTYTGNNRTDIKATDINTAVETSSF